MVGYIAPIMQLLIPEISIKNNCMMIGCAYLVT